MSKAKINVTNIAGPCAVTGEGTAVAVSAAGESVAASEGTALPDDAVHVTYEGTASPDSIAWALRRLAGIVDGGERSATKSWSVSGEGGHHAYTVEAPRLKRWDDPSVSWDDRARVAARAQDADVGADSRYKWDKLSMEDRAGLIAGISDLVVCPNDYHDDWVRCVHDALLAEGFEV